MTANQPTQHSAARSDTELVALARKALGSPLPSPGIDQKILLAATPAQQQRPRLRLLPVSMTSVGVAAAAALAIVLGIHYRPEQDTQPTQESEIGNINALVALVQQGDDAYLGVEAGNEDEELRALAQQLLELEGFTDEVLTFPEEELPEPPSTTLQSHSRLLQQA